MNVSQSGAQGTLTLASSSAPRSRRTGFPPRRQMRRLLAVALAAGLLAGTQAPARAMEDGERPDLKVEFVGLPLSATQRDVQIRVTNVSAWWADQTTARIQTVSPQAGNVVDLAVENLDPGQSTTLTYTLGAACTGQVVKVEVAAAKNYAGVPESNLANNQLQAQVCPATPQPQAPTQPQTPAQPQPEAGSVAALPYGPDTCVSGYVWRGAWPEDHVCVTPQLRDQAAADNSQAAARHLPGSDTCVSGYVWRGARPEDHVCVTPQNRDQTAADNAQANTRRAAAQPTAPAPANPSGGIYLVRKQDGQATADPVPSGGAGGVDPQAAINASGNAAAPDDLIDYGIGGDEPFRPPR
jgi:hypothetical protein